MRSGADYLKSRLRESLPRKGSKFTLAPDPAAPNVFQDEFANWVNVNFPYGQRDPSRPIYFSLDNEPELWPATHPEVHPAQVTYAELIQKTVDYARAIKHVLPGAVIFGPCNAGWLGMVSLQNASDAGRRDFQEFYLQKLAEARNIDGVRLVDVLDFHWYPEIRVEGHRITGQDNSRASVAARIQAPRSLWDPTFVEDSWICRDILHGPLKLLPTVKEKIARHDPGMKISISEYHFGGAKHISGGIAEADVLGIFGREGVFAANEWSFDPDESYIAAGFQMFRDYDGNRSTFGNISVGASTDSVEATSIYASLDSEHRQRMVLVCINKLDQAISATVQLRHAHRYGHADIYQLTALSSRPTSAGRLPLPDSSRFAIELPPMSVNTIELSQ